MRHPVPPPQSRCQRRLPAAALVAALAVALAVALVSCQGKPAADPRGELAAALGGADVTGYLFALGEGVTQQTSSLTNSAVLRPIALGKGDADVVLRYTRIEDRSARARQTYKAEVQKRGPSLALVVTELGTSNVVTRNLPATGGGAPCGPPAFASVNACVDSFERDCSRGGAALCAANRTCEPQFAALDCCLTSGQLVSVHLVVNPTLPRCLLRDLIPNLVLTSSPG
jgi:hypothetical protein